MESGTPGCDRRLPAANAQLLHPDPKYHRRPMLHGSEIEHFIEEGFIRIEHAFERATAEEARKILWRDTGCDPDDPATWTRPVIRLGMYTDEPFRTAASSPLLHEAFDQLVGEGRWRRPGALGTFPVRFPCAAEPNDAGWHVDASFPDPTADPQDYMRWRVNVRSDGRALLMLFLFSNVGDDDAPTRIRAGSHLEMARLLEPAGEAGCSPFEIEYPAGRREVLATGEAGTVYLCHPFLVHAAQAHRGKVPRFLAQPPLFPTEALSIERASGSYAPVELAIRRALGRA